MKANKIGMAVVNFQKFIVHIHDVVTSYNNCTVFLLTYYVLIITYCLSMLHCGNDAVQHEFVIDSM